MTRSGQPGVEREPGATEEDVPTRMEQDDMRLNDPEAQTQPGGEAPTRAEPADEPATLAEMPQSARERPGDGLTASATRNTHLATTTLFAMHVEEIRRTRAFAMTTAPFAVLVLALLPWIGGDSSARVGVAIGMGAILLGSIALLVAMRTDAGYTVARALAFGVLCLFAGYGGIYYFGIFSPAAAIVPFGLYFFSVGQSLSGTLFIYLLSAALEAFVGLAVVTGMLADRGLVRADGVPLAARLAILLLVEVTFFATFLVARASRRAMVTAIDEHDRAVRGLVQREELLKEARHDLERALEVGGLGRFTDEVVGAWRLGQVIGRGGMGEVYEATRVDTHEPAAVKLLHGHSLGSPDHVRRFLREAKIAASIASPNVVRVREIGGVDAPVPFLAMERLKGEDLADILRKHRRLATGKVVALVREVGRGLEAAREAGIVHRDLKPRNLFFAEEGARRTWKILDFGVSRLVADQATITGAQLLGTPSYMAPEQVKSGKVDHRADLYSLSVVCYRALTGRPAFSGDTMAEILYRVVNVMPMRPSASGKLDTDVDLALAVGLAKDPRDRYDSATELGDALETALRGELSTELRVRAEKILKDHPWQE